MHQIPTPQKSDSLSEAESVLVDDIMTFLNSCAKRAGTFEDDEEDPFEFFNGPDSAMMYAACIRVAKGLGASPVLSSWSSGCYREAGEFFGKNKHNSLVRRIRELDPER